MMGDGADAAPGGRARSLQAAFAVGLAALTLSCSAGPAAKREARQSRIDRHVSLTRQLGNLRFLETTAATGGLDWNAVAVEAAGQVEQGREPDLLAEGLRAASPSAEPPAPAPLATPHRKHIHLAAIGMAWNYIRHYYPYRDEFREEWLGSLEWALGETLNLHDTPLPEADRERLFFRILRHLVAMARDGQAAVTSPHAEDADYRPPLVCRLVEGHLIVSGPATGPVPVVPGDEIIRIEGVGPRLKMSYTADLISGSTERFVLHQAANESMAGPKDSPLNLRVMAHRKRPRYLIVRRTQDRAHRARDVRPGPIAQVAPGIWYIGGGRTTDADVNGALPRLAAARGLIVDLREEPAGLSLRRTLLPHLIDEPVASVPFDHPVFGHRGQAETRFVRRTWSIAPQAPRLKARVAFLADAGTVGEREVMLAMARHYRLGEIVGEPTAGTPGESDRALLPGGYGLSWTSVRALNYDGSRSDGGVEPTVPAALTREGLGQGRDDVLGRAVAELASPQERAGSARMRY